MTFDEFLNNPLARNVWIREPHISVYVRQSYRYIDKERFASLEIGNVEVDERFRGKGIFSTFLNKFENAATQSNRIVFIESVMNERLLFYLMVKRGYEMIPLTVPPTLINWLKYTRNFKRTQGAVNLWIEQKKQNSKSAKK